MDESYRINGIKLPNSSYAYVNENGDKSDILSHLSKMNLFIGENNSGKSLLIRELFSKKWTFIPNYSLEIVNKSNEQFINGVKNYALKYNIDYKDFEKFLDLGKIIPHDTIDDSSNNIVNILNLRGKIDDVYVNNKDQRHYRHVNLYFTQIGKELLKIYIDSYHELFKIHDDKLKNIETVPKYISIYIPTLRGLRPIADSFVYDNLYERRTKEVYFNNSLLDNRNIFTGLEIYKEVKNHLLGNLKKRKLIKEYEEYLSRNFFDNKPVALIPTEEKQVLTIKIGNESERPIYELGDGIQAIIVITFKLFMLKNEYLLLYIDEPEKFLHPGLQRKLLTTLLNEKGFEKFQYFITTHSNHFLDLTLDYSGISIFLLRKDIDYDNSEEIAPKFTISALSFGDVNALQILGVRNSSVFLSNCTIWVEGITDRWYLRKYLELYFKNHKVSKVYIEDYHYSFVEYGGANITHWSFIEKEAHPINVKTLCGKLFLITDNDNKINDDREESLKESLGGRYYKLECKEVENLLAPKVLKEILQSYGETAFPEPDYEAYKMENLGLYLDHLLNGNRARKGSYQNGNTISDKVEFCKKALNHLNSWDDLSDEAKAITELLFNFIKYNN